MTGLVWFPAALIIRLLTSKLGKTLVNSELLLPLLMVGNIFTLYLWYLELAVIHAVCPLCVSLYLVNYALTAIVLIPVVWPDRFDSEHGSAVAGDTKIG